MQQDHNAGTEISVSDKTPSATDQSQRSAPADEYDKRNIIFVLPTSMAARGLLDTPVIRLFGKMAQFRGLVLSPSEREQIKINNLGNENIQWRSIYQPAGEADAQQSIFNRVCRALCLRAISLLRADFPNLVYRFNEINGFVGHRQKAQMSAERKVREARAGNFVDPTLGVPWPRSERVLNILKAVYFGHWQCLPDSIRRFIFHTKPAVMILWNPQNALMKEYIVAARKFDIPQIIVITSWDMPTTKGPIWPHAEKYVVNSRAMKQELVEFHHISPQRVVVSGWPQMDVNTVQPQESRSTFLRRLGIDPTRKLILFAANSERLGAHEPSIARYLATEVAAGSLNQDCTLLVRPHPKDSGWSTRFGHVAELPHVVVDAPEWGKLDYLSCVLQYADVVVCSQGSITMDAVSLDTCVVNIGFDGDLLVSPSESVKKWYQMDHYKAVLETGGVCLAENYEELMTAVNTYLSDPAYKSAERKLLKSMQLEPLDGRASDRIVAVIADIANGHSSATVTSSLDSTVSV